MTPPLNEWKGWVFGGQCVRVCIQVIIIAFFDCEAATLSCLVTALQERSHYTPYSKHVTEDVVVSQSKKDCQFFQYLYHIWFYLSQ